MKTPGDISDFVNCQIGAESKEDTERSPHLPTHDQSTADRSRAILCGVDRDCRGFAAHSDTEKEPSDEKLGPGLRDGRTEDGKQAEDSGEEDCATTTEVVV